MLFDEHGEFVSLKLSGYPFSQFAPLKIHRIVKVWEKGGNSDLVKVPNNEIIFRYMAFDRGCLTHSRFMRSTCNASAI